MSEFSKTNSRHPGRAWMFVGMILAIGGVIIYLLLTFSANVLITPWYVPLLGTVGVALMVLALVRSRSIWRWTAVALFALFVGFQWLGVVAMRVPAYTGPSKDGDPFPAFASSLADGSAFTQDDLKGDQNTVMVFFRGHW